MSYLPRGAVAAKHWRRDIVGSPATLMRFADRPSRRRDVVGAASGLVRQLNTGTILAVFSGH